MSSAHSKTVFHISSTPWHFTWQHSHILTEQMNAAGWNVVYIDPLPKRWPALREWRRVLGRIRGNAVQAGKLRQREIPGVPLVLPRTLPDRGPVARWLNRHFLIPRLAEKLIAQTSGRPDLVVVSLPTQAALDLIAVLKPAFVMYNCFFDMTTDPTSPHDIAETERQLTEAADLIMIDMGIGNRERMQALNARNAIYHSGTTVDYADYAPARTVRTLAPDKAPVCCYFGELRNALDLERLAEASHRTHLRIIGPVAADVSDFSTTTEFIPAVPAPELPALLADVDILLLPYKRELLNNRAIFPAKVFQCLATGKPVIASGLPSLKPLEHIITLAEDDAAFWAALDAATDEVRNPHLPAHAERRAARLREAQAHDTAVIAKGWIDAIEKATQQKRAAQH